MPSLADHEKQLLLEIARRAMTAAVESREAPGISENDLAAFSHGGAFVTLHRRGRLRGCIGQLDSIAGLFRIIAHCAKAAALEDPRFDPVQSHELTEIEIELSVLSHPEEAALERIEAGRHGLIVSRGRQRGVLLPQVALQYGWTAERFLEETCEKAGFERTAWKESGTLIHAFTAEVFSEREFFRGDRNRDGSAGGVKPRYSIST